MPQANQKPYVPMDDADATIQFPTNAIVLNHLDTNNHEQSAPSNTPSESTCSTHRRLLPSSIDLAIVSARTSSTQSIASCGIWWSLPMISSMSCFKVAHTAMNSVSFVHTHTECIVRDFCSASASTDTSIRTHTHLRAPAARRSPCSLSLSLTFCLYLELLDFEIECECVWPILIRSQE